MTLNKIFHDKQGRIVLAQIPNRWLTFWLLCELLTHLLYPGRVRDLFIIIGTLSLFIWALLEIFRGDAYFRRALGTLVVVIILVRIFTS